MAAVQDYTEIKTLNNIQITIGDENLVKIAKAISSPTRQKILLELYKQPLDVSRIAGKLKQTEANISAQIQILQKAGLVTSHYEPGNHGVRKICEVTFTKLEINIA